MLTKLKLENFQSHKKSELEFVNGVNIICGTSNSGKSSIIRALNLLFFNKPKGNQYRSYFTKKKENTTVEIEIDNKTISRIRGALKNAYQIDNKNFDAFNNEVIHEIDEVLNVNEINLQSQFDQFFLLNETSGTISKKLNSIVGLDIIDKSISYLNKLIKKESSKLDYLNLDLKEKELELENYNDLDFIREKKEDLILNWNNFVKLQEKRNLISELLINYEVLKNDIVALELKIKFLNRELVKIKKSINKYEELIHKKELIDEFVMLRKQIEKYSKLNLENELKNFEKQIKELKKVETEKEVILEFIKYINEIKIIKKLIEESEKEKNEIESKLEICDYCGAYKINWRK